MFDDRQDAGKQLADRLRNRKLRQVADDEVVKALRTFAGRQVPIAAK